MRESKFQANLRVKLADLFPGCIILKNDANYMQGMLDLLILFGNRWAMLECKASENSPIQPNQHYYVQLCNELSFASFIYPENEEEVLYGLQVAFGTRR